MAMIRSIDPEANLAAVRRAYAAFQAGDIAAVLDGFATDAWFECHGAPHLPCAGRWEGHEGLTGFFMALGSMAEILAFVPGPLVPVAGGRVLAEGTEHMRFRGSGREVRTRWLHLFTVGGGLILSGVEWNEGAALAAAFRGD